MEHFKGGFSKNRAVTVVVRVGFRLKIKKLRIVYGTMKLETSIAAAAAVDNHSFVTRDDRASEDDDEVE